MEINLFFYYLYSMMNKTTKQGLNYSLIGYFGFFLGTISNIFIFPYNWQFYGKLRYILPTAEMLLPIVVFGVSYSNVKFFNFFSREKKQQNMLFLSLLFVLLNFIFCSILFFVIANLFSSVQKIELWKMKFVIFPLTLMMALCSVFNKYLSNFKKIAIPNIFDNLFPKFANILAFTSFCFLGFSEYSSLFFLFSVFLSSLICYTFYTNKIETLHVDLSTQYIKNSEIWKPFLIYGFFSFLGNIGNYIAVRIDNMMIGDFIGFKENGIYSTILNMITLMTIPQLGINTMFAPVINKCIEKEKFNVLNKLHQKTSLHLLSIGLFFFSCILVGFPFLTSIIKNGKDILNAKSVLWILVPAIGFDLATGFNGHIISLSKYYRFNIFIILLLALMNILLNLLFITKTNLGIQGVAIATATSLTLFNLIKIVFNYIKFKVFPFSLKMISVILLCAFSIFITFLIPTFKNNFLNLLFKPMVLVLILFTFNFCFNIYPIPWKKMILKIKK